MTTPRMAVGQHRFSASLLRSAASLALRPEDRDALLADANEHDRLADTLVGLGADLVDQFDPSP